MIANIIRNAKKTVTGGDPYYSAVSLLLPMDGTNGSTTFTDSSLNGLTVTAVGNAQISTTQSKYGGASGYFDGTGDYLTLPTSTVLQFGTGDFTVEMWVYKTASKAYMAFAGNLSTGTNATMWQIISDSTGNKITWFSSGFVITGATTLNVNTWYHVAVSRNGTNLRLFINGILDGSATNSHNYSSTNQVFLAQVPELLSARDFAGFIDDFRISRFARYTSTFTPPTAALPTTASSTPADPYYGYTSLLLHMDGTNASTNFVDSGPNALAVTAVGNAQVSTSQSKYGGASAYFDGAGDYLSFTGGMPSGSGTAFTIECWIRLDNLSSYRAITRTAGGLDIGVQPNGLINCDQTSVGIIANSATGVITAGTWYHIAVTRDTSNNYKIYVNGTQVASGTNSFSVTAATTIGFSAFSGAHYFKGYIDDFRATNVLRYTSNFTPPTAAFPNS